MIFESITRGIDQDLFYSDIFELILEKMNFILFLTIFCLAITSQSTKTMKQELKGSGHLSKSDHLIGIRIERNFLFV